jgi:hypothetical protein
MPFSASNKCRFRQSRRNQICQSIGVAANPEAFWGLRPWFESRMDYLPTDLELLEAPNTAVLRDLRGGATDARRVPGRVKSTPPTHWRNRCRIELPVAVDPVGDQITPLTPITTTTGRGASIPALGTSTTSAPSSRSTTERSLPVHGFTHSVASAPRSARSLRGSPADLWRSCQTRLLDPRSVTCPSLPLIDHLDAGEFEPGTAV